MNLYIASHIRHIEKLDEKESQELSDKLYNHAKQDKYVVTIDWKGVGDLMIWDNTCTMHRAMAVPAFLVQVSRGYETCDSHDSGSQAWCLNEHSDVRQ